MFKKTLLLLAAILYSLSVNAQYNGGINDGFVFSSTSNSNASPNIYRGGNHDGFSFINVNNQNAGPTIYFGGSNDGFSFISVANQNAVPNIYTGGSDDGFSFIIASNQNAVPNIYTGGNDDGFSVINVSNQNGVPNIYTGGSNDGFNQVAVMGLNASPGIYVGGASDGWVSLMATNQNQSVIPSPFLNLKLFIEGYYAGNNLMLPVLFNNTLSNDPTACDSITVALRDAQNPSMELASAKTVLHSNGNATVLLSNALFNRSLYIVIKHKNSIETWSKLPVTIGSNTIFDFTIPE
ncbi:MAG: hypothetical protein IPO63_03010 [Bacteroidetes bacterium]|nr:hypothetical protein [Bacteroidota bacterium]